MPPREVEDVLAEVRLAADLIVCPVLGTLAPGVPRVVDIGRDGDTTVLGVPLEDCPPYGDMYPPPPGTGDGASITVHLLPE